MDLIYLLSNTIVLLDICALLPFRSLLAIATTSKSLRALLLETPHVFRYLDLSAIQPRERKHPRRGLSRANGSVSPAEAKLDSYNYSYLANCLRSLSRQRILRDVSTLILDGLYVPQPQLRVLLCDESNHIRLLSLRGVSGIDHVQFRRLIYHLIRRDRPTGTPRLKGVYYFGYKFNEAGLDDSAVDRSLRTVVLSSKGGVVQLNPGAPVLKARSTSNAGPHYHEWVSTSRIVSIRQTP